MAMNYKRLGGKQEAKTLLTMTVGELVTPDDGATIWLITSRTRSTIVAENNGVSKVFSPMQLLPASGIHRY